MNNKFHIEQKVRGFYGVDARWGQGKDELFIVTGVEEFDTGGYRYDLMNAEKGTATYGSHSSAPERLLISEADWQKLPEWYRLEAFRVQALVNQAMKEMGY